MNEANKSQCGCNPCVGPSCTCGCQSTVAQEVCTCVPQCRCGDSCREVKE